MGATKLLVVDDEPDFADFVSEVAKTRDFDVISTSEPSRFSTIYSTDIEVFVLDLFMPGIDGIELLRFLADKRSVASVVLMSGKDKGILRSAQELAIEQGIKVLGTLEKPFRALELEEILTSYRKQSPAQGPVESDEFPSLAEYTQAIEQQEMYLVYQPQVGIRDRNMVGVEALIRWRHPRKGMVPPGYFIPEAEHNNLISEINSFVFSTAIKQQAEWRNQGLDLQMSINMSAKILDNLDLPEELANQAGELGIETSNIVLEVTETGLMSDVARYLDILTRLRMKGFKLSIDDFGIGYSSLQKLVRIPFTELKIDQSFIRNLVDDDECYSVAEISISLAHKLGMHVVAEGIEDESIWNILWELGCDVGQGYWIGGPMSAGEMSSWVEKWS